ncbi:hypothetical protein FIBSPDRAFT_507623 [Athelia psychrophila]|uniref:F-box domain-containing protein n=1 Tax=Athelia psychrophila TaxID=1759441 RepID=A0A166K381_9AGAM|nr:hypothetical protein FIBSPDRAFT_507623 [Fibularhizoctonia sp. CBS 109695]
MHRCLWIPEIISIITEEIAVHEAANVKPTSWSTLAHLARTCRTLSEASLNSLWKVQSSLLPLLHTMPADLWEDRDRQLFLCRPMKPADWARFHIYARRIYHFLPTPLPGKPFGRTLPTPECLQALSCSKPRNLISLCPQVRSLDWEYLVASDPSLYQYMPLFMGAFTTKVLFGIEELELVELSLVQSMLCLFPSIRDIDIRNVSTDLDAEALAECLSHGQSLRKVHIEDVLPQAVAEHLAGFQHLKRLNVTVNQHLSSTRLSGFCALKDLVVTSSTFPLISTFINMLTSPLRHITLSVDDEDGEADIDPQGLTHTFDAIGLHCSHLHLQSLKVLASYREVPDSPHSFVDASAFKPLLAFQNLSSLKLQLNAPFRMGNQTIRDMVKAWPQLTSLIIGNAGWLGGSSVTPAGLVYLLGLQHLHTLAISIDASKLDVDLVLDSAKTLSKNTKITHPNFQDSIIYDVRPMAALLSIIAPNIERIESWAKVTLGNQGDLISPESAKEYQHRWREVAERVRDWR